MRFVEIDRRTRKRMNFLLVPLKNIQSIEIAEDEDGLETEKIHLNTTDGIAFMDADHFVVLGKSLDELINEREGKK